MIVLGVVLLLIGVLIQIPVLTTIGGILIVVGAVLAILGFAGKKVAGRSHWF